MHLQSFAGRLVIFGFWMAMFGIGLCVIADITDGDDWGGRKYPGDDTNLPPSGPQPEVFGEIAPVLEPEVLRTMKEVVP